MKCALIMMTSCCLLGITWAYQNYRTAVMGIVTIGAIFAMVAIGCYMLFLSGFSISLMFGYITAGLQIFSGLFTYSSLLCVLILMLSFCLVVNVFGSGSDSMPLLVVLVGVTLYNKSLTLHPFRLDQDKIWQECSSSKCALSQIFDLTSYFQDGGYVVISYGKVLPSGECTQIVCPTDMQ